MSKFTRKAALRRPLAAGAISLALFLALGALFEVVPDLGGVQLAQAQEDEKPKKCKDKGNGNGNGNGNKPCPTPSPTPSPSATPSPTCTPGGYGEPPVCSTPAPNFPAPGSTVIDGGDGTGEPGTGTGGGSDVEDEVLGGNLNRSEPAGNGAAGNPGVRVFGQVLPLTGRALVPVLALGAGLITLGVILVVRRSRRPSVSGARLR